MQLYLQSSVGEVPSELVTQRTWTDWQKKELILQGTMFCLRVLQIDNNILMRRGKKKKVQQQFTSSRSVKLILWRSLSSSAWSGTDIWVVYLMWGKEWGVRALLRPAPGVDSGEISLVRRLSTTTAESFFLFFSEDRLAFFFCTPQSCSKTEITFAPSFMLILPVRITLNVASLHWDSSF